MNGNVVSVGEELEEGPVRIAHFYYGSAALMGVLCAAYEAFLGGREDSLRAVTARNFIAARDTALSSGAFDNEKLERIFKTDPRFKPSRLMAVLESEVRQ